MIEENQVNKFSIPIPQIAINVKPDENLIHAHVTGSQLSQSCEIGKQNQHVLRKQNTSNPEINSNNPNSTVLGKIGNSTQGNFIQLKKNEILGKQVDFKQDEGTKNNKIARQKSVSQGQFQLAIAQSKEKNGNYSIQQGVINQGSIQVGGAQTPKQPKGGLAKQSDNNLKSIHESLQSEEYENNSKQKIWSYSFIPKDDQQERIVQIKGGIMIDEKCIIDKTCDEYLPHQNFSQYIECNAYQKVYINTEENGQDVIEVIEIPIKKKEGENQFDNLIQSFRNESFYQSQEIASQLEQYQGFINGNVNDNNTNKSEPFTYHNQSKFCQNLQTQQNKSNLQINDNSKLQINTNKDITLVNQALINNPNSQQISQATKIEAGYDLSKNNIGNNNKQLVQSSMQQQQNSNQNIQISNKRNDSSNEEQNIFRKQINEKLVKHKSEYFSYVVVFKKNTELLLTQDKKTSESYQNSNFMEDEPSLFSYGDIQEMRIGHNSNFLTLLSQNQEELASKMIREKKFCIFNTKLDREKYLSYIKFRIKNEMSNINKSSYSFPQTCLASLDQIFNPVSCKDSRQSNQSAKNINSFHKQSFNHDDNPQNLENRLNSSASTSTTTQQQTTQQLQQTLQQQQQIKKGKNSANKKDQILQNNECDIAINSSKKCPFQSSVSQQDTITSLNSNGLIESHIIVKSYKQMQIITLDDLSFTANIDVIEEECPLFKITIFKYDISDTSIKEIELNRGNPLIKQGISLNSSGNNTPFQRKPGKKSSIKQNLPDISKSRDKSISMSGIDDKMRSKQLASNKASSSLKNIPLTSSLSSDIFNFKNKQYEDNTEMFLQKFYPNQKLSLTKTKSDIGFGGHKTIAEGSSTTKSSKRKMSFTKESNQLGTFSSEIQAQQKQLQVKPEQNHESIDEEYLEQQFQMNNPTFYNCNQQEPINSNSQCPYQQTQSLQIEASQYSHIPINQTQQYLNNMNNYDQFQNYESTNYEQKIQQNFQSQQAYNQQVIPLSLTNSILKIQIPKPQEIQDIKQQKIEIKLNQEINSSQQISKQNSLVIQNEQPAVNSEEQQLKLNKKVSQRKKQKKEEDEEEDQQKTNKTKKIKKENKEEDGGKQIKSEQKSKKNQKGSKKLDEKIGKEDEKLKEEESKIICSKQSNTHQDTVNEVNEINNSIIPSINIAKIEGEPKVHKNSDNENQQELSQYSYQKHEDLQIHNLQQQNQNVYQQYFQPQPGTPTSQSSQLQQYQSVYDNQNQNYNQLHQNYYQQNGIIYSQQYNSQHDIQQMNYNMYSNHPQAQHYQNSQQIQMSCNQQQQYQVNQYGNNNLQPYPQHFIQSPYIAYSPQINYSPYQIVQQPSTQSPSPSLIHQQGSIPASTFTPLDLNTQNNYLKNQMQHLNQQQSQIQSLQNQQVQQQAQYQVPQQKVQQNISQTTIPQLSSSEKQQKEEIIQQQDNQKNKSEDQIDDQADKKKQRKKRQSKPKKQNDSPSKNSEDEDDEENENKRNKEPKKSKKIAKNKDEENKKKDENPDNKNQPGETKKSKQKGQTKKIQQKEEQKAQSNGSLVENTLQQQQNSNQQIQNQENVNQEQIGQLQQYNIQDPNNLISQYDYSKYQIQYQQNFNQPNNLQQNQDQNEKDYYNSYGYPQEQSNYIFQDELQKQQYQQYQASSYQPEYNNYINNQYKPQIEQQQIDQQQQRDPQLLQQTSQKAESSIKTPKNTKKSKESKSKQAVSNTEKNSIQEKHSDTQ